MESVKSGKYHFDDHCKNFPAFKRLNWAMDFAKKDYFNRKETRKVAYHIVSEEEEEAFGEEPTIKEEAVLCWHNLKR